MPRTRWAKYERRLDIASIAGTLALNLLAFLAGIAIAGGAGLVRRLANGFFAWSLAIPVSYCYWLWWIHARSRYSTALKLGIALVLLALHGIAWSVVTVAGSSLATLA